jgi:hypothetical protein
MGQALIEALRRALDRPTPYGRTTAELLAEVLLAKAVAGDIQAIRLVWEIDRSEGSVAQQAAEPAPVAGRIEVEPAVARPIPPRRRRAV